MPQRFRFALALLLATGLLGSPAARPALAQDNNTGEVIAGIPTRGPAGVSKTVAEIMALQAVTAPRSGNPEDMENLFKQPDRSNLPQNPGSPELPVSKALDITYIEFDPPGSDLDGEYVRIQNNTGRAIELTGWTLHDGADKHVFTFPTFTLATGGEVRIWTKTGASDAANLYWGSRSAIWNNTGDTARLLDAGGKEISRYSYIGK